MNDQNGDFTLSTRRLVMFSDLNSGGRLYGGRLLSWMDEAAAMFAMRIIGTKVLVTRKIGEVVFDAPGMLGDYVEIWCRPDRRGRTSLTVDCRVIVRDVEEEAVRQICRSTFVYVALNADGRPVAWGPRPEKQGEST